LFLQETMEIQRVIRFLLHAEHSFQVWQPVANHGQLPQAGTVGHQQPRATVVKAILEGLLTEQSEKRD
jgi:hypothetical protein